MESANWKKQKVQLRRGTAAEWAARNTLLLLAEPGYETDTQRIKYGDGVTRWSSLPYWSAGESAAITAGDYGQVIVNADGTWSVDITPADIGASAVGHTHSASEIASGTLSDLRLSGNVVLTADARLSDAREWSAGTISQADAEAGVSTARQAFTALRVFQAIAAWWAGSAAKAKLDGIASGATANSTDAQLRDRSTHTGSQAISTVSGLQAALDGKAELAHSHSGSDITSGTVAYARLPVGSTALTVCAGDDSRLSDARAPLSHTHDDRYYTEAEVDSLLAGKQAAGTYATLVGGTVPTNQLPTYVQTVAGRSGTVTLAKDDVGLSNVDNTSDANKPISTAAQTALDLKAPLASPAFTGQVAIPAGSASTPPLTFSGDTDTGLLAPAANNIAFSTGGVERARIDNAGRILVATSVSRSAGPTIHPQFQMEGASAGAASFQFAAASTTAAVCPQVLFARHRGAVGGSDAVVANDSLGLISFTGGDGTDINNRAAFISAEVDGTPDTGSIPGRIVFATTIQGGANTLEKMRITNDGKVGIGTAAPASLLHVNGALRAASLTDGTLTKSMSDVLAGGGLSAYGSHLLFG